MQLFVPGDGVLEFEEGKIRYRYQTARSDRRRVLLVFSGYRKKGTLDFSGAGFDPIRHDIIWIYDEFGDSENYSYYLREGGTNNPELLVEKLVDLICDQFNIEREMIISTGFSKGGTAALYFALKLGLGGTVVTVPQFFIGDYVRGHWSKSDVTMTGGEQPVETLNSILPDLLNSHLNSEVPVYLITSEVDDQYPTQIQPMLKTLQHLKNFSIIEANSSLVTKHTDVTPYSVPIIQALLLLLLNGLKPEIGYQFVEDWKQESSKAAELSKGQAVGNLRSFSLDGEKFLIEAETILKGYPLAKHGLMKRELLIGNRRFRLGSINDPSISARYSIHGLQNYATGLSTTIGGAKEDLSGIDDGEHAVAVELTYVEPRVKAQTQLSSKKNYWTESFSQDRIYALRAGKRGSTLVKNKIEQVPSFEFGLYNSVESCSLTDDGLVIQGRFAPPGAVVQEWGDARYYLLLENESGALIDFRLGMLHRPIGMPKNLAKSFYSNIGGKPISFEGCADGKYSAQVLIFTDQLMMRTGKLFDINVVNGVARMEELKG